MNTSFPIALLSRSDRLLDEGVCVKSRKRTKNALQQEPKVEKLRGAEASNFSTASPVVSTIGQPGRDASFYPDERLEQYAEITRNLILQEIIRLNERTTWLLQLQGLLFTALAFAWKDARPLVWLLIAVGILSSLSIGKTLHWAVKSMDNLEVEWEAKGGLYRGPRIIGLGRNDRWHHEMRLLLHSAHNLPIIFTIAWLIVLWFQVKR